MPQNYRLRIANESDESVNACLYQTEPGSGVEGAMSLAWLVQTIPAGGSLIFRWTDDYCYAWAPTPQLQPGSIFLTAQLMLANLQTASQVTFTSDQGALMFVDPKAGPFPDSLVIVETDRIPVETAAVGIGMSAAATIAVQAAPSTNLVFTPDAEYWFTTGAFTTGQVLDLPSLANTLRIDFPKDVFEMTVIIDADGSFRLVPSEEEP